MSRAVQRKKRRFVVPHVAPVVRFGGMGIAFLLGFWGFTQAYAEAGMPVPLTQSALRAVRLIVGNFPEALENRNLPLSLQVARWALPLLTFWSTAALAWEQLRNPLRLALIRARGDHVVLYGDDDGGLARQAALGALEEGRRVLIWPRDKRAFWLEDAQVAGAAVLEQQEPGDSATRLALDKARAVLLLASEARANIALAPAILEQAAAVRAAGDPLDVILRIDDADLRRGVEQRFEHVDRKTARARIAALPDIIARQLILDRPLDRFMREGTAGRDILVIGLTPVIERIMLRTLAGSHFRDGRRPRFHLFAADADQAGQGFRARNPAADALSPVSFTQARPDPATIAALIDEHVAAQGEPVAVLVDLDDDDRTLALALAIDARYRRLGIAAPPIHAHMNDLVGGQLGVDILPFGDLAGFADPDMLLQDRHDMLARSVHDFYLEGRFAEGERIGARASMQEWEDLPESFRDDNRLLADCYQIKLRDIGARLIAGGGPALTLGAEELEELSRAEHDRWMAAKLVQGWKHGAVRDDTNRLHPDIVPYDQLSEAIKDLDREQVRMMTRLLGMTGQRAVRGLTVAILPGMTVPDPAPLLDALATHYPDRVPLFLGALADEGSRAMMLALHDAGQLVQIALTGHAQAVIDGMPTGEARATTALIHDADRLVALPANAAPEAALSAGAELLVSFAPHDDPRAIFLGAAGEVTRAPWTA